MSYLFDYVPSVPTPPGGVAGDIQVNNGAGGFAGETLLPLANGGTDANLSLTGGTSYVLRQSSVGAAITVSQLGYSELSGLPTLAVTKAAVTSYWLSAYNATTGAFSTAQPTFSDLSAHPTTLGGYGITDAISSGVMTTLGDTLYENVTPTPTKLSGNITTTKMYLSQTGNGATSAAPVWAQINYSDIAGTNPTPPSGSVLWSALGNAGAALTLANAGYATTFNHPSAVNWTWANTTASIVSFATIGFVGAVAIPSTAGVLPNTAGATLLVAHLSCYQGAGSVTTISDSLGNAWTYLTTYNNAGFIKHRIAYAYAKTGGGALVTGSDTFTLADAGGNGASGIVYAFSNTDTTSAVYTGSQNGATFSNAAFPVQLGSVTPNQYGLVVSGFSANSGLSAASADSGFSTAVLQTNSTNNTLAAAYLVSSTGNAVNPTWTSTNVSTVFAGANACFKAGTTPTIQSSPIWNLATQYWNGSSSAADTWSIQDVIGAGFNGTSTLTIAHTGSSGVAAVQVPILNAVTDITTPLLSATTNIMSPLHLFTSAADVGISRLGAASLAIGNGTANDVTGKLTLAQLILSATQSPASNAAGTAGGK